MPDIYIYDDGSAVERPVASPEPTLQWKPFQYSERDLLHMQALALSDRSLLELAVEAFRLPPETLGETTTRATRIELPCYLVKRSTP